MKLLSDWLASRPRKTAPSTIVLHATDGASAGSSISWLRKIGLSYHFVIERDGTVTKCVPYLSRVAFHAGKSEGPNGSNVNEYSIGIAFANFESRKEPITSAQLAAAQSLIVSLLPDMAPGKRYLTTHYAIAPKRKTDPAMLSRTWIRKVAAECSLIPWRVGL